MTYNLLREGGIGALACIATNNNAYPLLHCSFQIKHKDGSHATFSLQHSTHVHGFDEAQPFHFIYDADNLVPATTTCMTTKRDLGLTESGHIARNQVPDIRALSLNLRKPCAIICPEVPGSIAPKLGHEIPFTHLVNLAKATEVTILFDWKWLHKSQHGPFLTIVSQPETITGFPINGKNLRKRRLVDWSIFTPVEEHDEESINPPPYVDANRKRPRQISSSPSHSSPPKRIDYTPEGSPTEKATTIATSSQQLSTIDDSPRPHRAHFADSTHINPQLEDAMKKMMQQMFPEMLAQFIDTSKSISSSPPPTSDRGSIRTSAPPSPLRHLRSSLRAFLSSRTTALFEQKLTAICDNTVYDAQYMRVAADEDFISAIEEQKLDIQTRKRDALEDLQEDINTLVDEKLRDLDATVAEYMEEAEEQVERVVNNKVDYYLNRKYVKDFASRITDMSGQRSKRDGRTAGDRKRRKFRRRV
ncbi:unnamed protein product [Periconia digitata]|uniref:Uncharacterized protein n=1 Tax=Periconia digitata TaxID=1303443 RepID=A0A9W4XVB3_9PLEO|nr:unnamed protein product [Periconia digitata]